MTASASSRRSTAPTAASAEVLVALLRAQLGTAAAPEPGSLVRCDWEHVARLAAHHGVTPLLYQPLREQAQHIPAELLRRMRFEYAGNTLRNQLVARFVDEIAGALRAERIAVILLKGAALLRTLYPDPGLRYLSDIDVLVDEPDLERAGARLSAIGLRSGGYGQESARGPLCHMHLYYRRPGLGSIPVELHWRLFEGYQPYVFDLADVQARAEPVHGMPDGVYTMSPVHELAHLCLHLERHAMVYRSLLARRDWFELLVAPQGLGRLVWLYDVALSLLQRGAQLDWDDLVATARRWAIDAHLYAVFELCRRALGVAPPPAVLAALNRAQPRLADRLAHGVLLASRRSLEQHTGWPRADGTDWATALAPSVLRLTHTWTTLFPPSAYLRAAYPAQRSAIARRAHHLQAVAPALWAEVRERLAPATED